MTNSAWFLLVLPGLIWGASFLFIAEALRATGPNGVTFGRICIGCATLALFPAARRSVGREDWGKIVLLGVLWFAFPLSMFPYAEQRVSSALTGMLNGATPLFATLVAWLLVGHAPSRGVVIGLSVGIGGAVLMAVPAMGEGESSAIGVLLIIAALISYGFALNLARELQMKYGSVPVLWRSQIVGLLLTAPLGLPALASGHWSLTPVLSLGALGALGTAVAYVALTSAAGKFGASRASATTFLIPPVALLLGVTIRHERVAWLALAGGVVCLLGAWLMKRDSGRA